MPDVCADKTTECDTAAQQDDESDKTTECDTTKVSQNDSDDMVEAQRTMSEAVGSMASQMQRVGFTCATRISDLDSVHFQNDMSAAAETQRTLVQAAKSATGRLLAGVAEEGDVAALVDEALVALMNDLMLSESSEVFFGISVPGSDTVGLQQGIPDDLLGLLAYRTWQLLTRTKLGRATLLECGGQDAAMVDSYEAVHGVLVDAIMHGKQIELFSACVAKTPTGNGRATGHNAPVLSRYEKTRIESAVRDGALDWRLVHLQ